jgi:cell wall hydrolase
LLLVLIQIAPQVIDAAAQSSQETAPAKRRSSAKSRIQRPSPEMIKAAAQRLGELGYWIGRTDGKLDEPLRQAMIAFQKIEGRSITGRISQEELDAMQAATRPSPRETGYAHVEVDLARQVLFVVDGETVTRILPVSTGNGKPFTSEGWTRNAVTPPGRFDVHHKIPGWRRSPLGALYYPSYIVGGIAIHGNPSVPTYPASHGCIRIPMFAAKEFYEMTPIGTRVLVY